VVRTARASLWIGWKKAVVEVPVVDDGRSPSTKRNTCVRPSGQSRCGYHHRFAPDLATASGGWTDFQIDAANAKRFPVAVFDVTTSTGHVYQQVEAQLACRSRRQSSQKRGADWRETQG